MKLYISTFIAILLLHSCVVAQSPQYTNITATLSDNQAQVWANALWTATIVPPFGNPSPLNNGGIPTIGTVSGVADNNGVINVTLDDNTAVLPSGSTWRFTICPNSTVKVCSTSIQFVHGGSMNLSTSIRADLTNVVVAASPTIYRAYADTEVTGGQGAIYWNTTNNTLRGFNGSTWLSIGTGGGGSGSWSSLTAPTTNTTIAMGGFTTLFNLGNTGTVGTAFDITDANNNPGTNYLFRVWTGAGSTAKTVAFCTLNTNDCVQMANDTFNAIGNAQLIATGVLNNGPGVGVVQLGSNGSGVVGPANTIVLTGNSNQAFISENGGALSKILLGGQITCGANTSVQSINTAGAVTCFTPSQMIPIQDITGASLNTGIAPAHMVIGAGTLVAGSKTITLNSAAQYLSSVTYTCILQDNTASNATSITYTSGTQFTLHGTGTDFVQFICTGQ